MSTQAQIAANQTNSQLSTGPTSEQGKANSSRNAVKLGLFSATAFIPPDEREEYEDFCADYLGDLNPKTAVEDTLADEIIQVHGVSAVAPPSNNRKYHQTPIPSNWNASRLRSTAPAPPLSAFITNR